MYALNKSEIITASEDYLLVLCDSIYKSKDFAKVENNIAKASKIRLGLKALENTDLPLLTQDRILIGLNNLCQIYND